jgi:hypothetical protein
MMFGPNGVACPPMSSAGAAPDQRFGVIGVLDQYVGDQLHRPLESHGIAVHAGEHVLAHLEVEALLGKRGDAHRECEQQDGQGAHG